MFHMEITMIIIFQSLTNHHPKMRNQISCIIKIKILMTNRFWIRYTSRVMIRKCSWYRCECNLFSLLNDKILSRAWLCIYHSGQNKVKICLWSNWFWLLQINDIFTRDFLKHQQKQYGYKTLKLQGNEKLIMRINI